MAFRERIFPTWVRLTRIDRNVRRKSSDRGRLLGTATFICGAVGLDTDISYVYQLFALMLCLLIAARISLGFKSPNVNVRRRLPRYATVGETFDYHVTLFNEGEVVERALRILDNPKVVPPAFKEYQARKEPGEETRNAYDRWIGFHRFVWLQKLKTGITINPADAPDVERLSRADACLQAVPLRRGRVQFESITVLHPDPFGIYYGVQEFDARESLVVLPKRYQIAHPFQFLGGRNFQPGGVNATWSVGESDEFVSLRDYREGDPIRKIHWPSTAKRDKPVVKEFQDEFFVRQGLMVDNFSQDMDTFEEVVSVAATILTSQKNEDGLTDLMTMAEAPQVLTSGRGYAQTSAQLEALALLNQTSSDVQPMLDLLNERSQLMSACIFVFGHMDTARLKLIQAAQAKGLEASVFVVVEDGQITQGLQPEFHLLNRADIQAGLDAL